MTGRRRRRRWRNEHNIIIYTYIYTLAGYILLLYYKLQRYIGTKIKYYYTVIRITSSVTPPPPPPTGSHHAFAPLPPHAALQATLFFLPLFVYFSRQNIMLSPRTDVMIIYFFIVTAENVLTRTCCSCCSANTHTTPSSVSNPSLRARFFYPLRGGGGARVWRTSVAAAAATAVER